ncbi:MAG: hypothetical protein GXP55_02750 [Deltaproteobacteria bacterium]|nr:hypothetical protein [Deltaproteobacteria bacterium]
MVLAVEIEAGALGQGEVQASLGLPGVQVALRLRGRVGGVALASTSVIVPRARSVPTKRPSSPVRIT